MAQMSQDEYVANLGNKCPNCGSDEVESTGLEDKDADYCTFNIGCSSCGATWTDTYTLKGYNNLEI